EPKKTLKNSSVVGNYILWIAVIVFAITAISYITIMYQKSKNVALNNPIPDVTLLKNNIQVIKAPNGLYKISLDQSFKVDNAKSLELIIKDEDGNIICTCYYKQTGLVCDNNCSVEGKASEGFQ
ncbi:MAG: hypothetical protein ABGW69_00240, partial [Nanoarchaeota archaeon]